MTEIIPNVIGEGLPDNASTKIIRQFLLTHSVTVSDGMVKYIAERMVKNKASDRIVFSGSYGNHFMFVRYDYFDRWFLNGTRQNEELNETPANLIARSLETKQDEETAADMFSVPPVAQEQAGNFWAFNTESHEKLERLEAKIRRFRELPFSPESVHQVNRIEIDTAKLLVLAERLQAFDALPAERMSENLDALASELERIWQAELNAVKAEFDMHSRYIQERQGTVSRLQLTGPDNGRS